MTEKGEKPEPTSTEQETGGEEKTRQEPPEENAKEPPAKVVEVSDEARQEQQQPEAAEPLAVEKEHNDEQQNETETKAEKEKAPEPPVVQENEGKTLDPPAVDENMPPVEQENEGPKQDSPALEDNKPPVDQENKEQTQAPPAAEDSKKSETPAVDDKKGNPKPEDKKEEAKPSAEQKGEEPENPVSDKKQDGDFKLVVYDEYSTSGSEVDDENKLHRLPKKKKEDEMLHTISVEYTVADAETWVTDMVSQLGKTRDRDQEDLVSKILKGVRHFVLKPLTEHLCLIEGLSRSLPEFKTQTQCEDAIKNLKHNKHFVFKLSDPLRFFLTKGLPNLLDKVLGMQFSVYAVDNIARFLNVISCICSVLVFYDDPDNPRIALQQERARLTEEQKKAVSPTQWRNEGKAALEGDATFQSYRLLERLFDPNRRFYKVHDVKPKIFIDVINKFFGMNGFKRMVSRINSPNSRLGPEDIYMMLRPMELSREKLIGDFIAGFVDQIIDRIYERICAFKVEDFRDLERDLVSSTLRAVQVVLRGASKGKEAEEKVLKITLHLIDLLLHLHQLDMRVLGLRELNELVKKASNPPAKASARGSYLGLRPMINWIQDHDVVKLLLDVNTTHHEIVKRSEPILLLLSENGALSKDQLSFIWRCAVKPSVGDALQKATFELFVTLCTTFSPNLWKHFDSFFCDLNLATMTSSPTTSEIFHNFLTNFLSASIAAGLLDGLRPSEKRDSLPHCMNFIWDTLMVECSEGVVGEQTDALLCTFCNALLSPVNESHKNAYDLLCKHFLSRAVKGITDRVHVASCLVFISRLIDEAKAKMRSLKSPKKFREQTLEYVEKSGIIDIVLRTMEEAVALSEGEAMVSNCLELLKSVLLTIMQSYPSFGELVMRLWNLLIRNKKMRPTLFTFLLSVLCKEGGQETEQLIAISSLRELDATEFGEDEWNFFYEIFCDINEDNKALTYVEKTESYKLSSPDRIDNLFAIETYWHIALGTSVEKVATQTRKFLLDLLQVESSDGFTGAVEQTLKTCIGTIGECCKDPVEQKRLQCLHALYFINAILESKRKNCIIEGSHMSMSKSMPFRVILYLTRTKMQKFIEVCANDTVQHVRDIAVERFSLKDPEHVLLFSGGFMLENPSGTLFDYGVKADSRIIVNETTKAPTGQAQQHPKTQPITGVLAEQPTHELLVALLKSPLCSDEQILDILFRVLCILPTDAKLLFDIKSGGASAVDCLKKSSSSTPELLYVLMAIDSFVTGTDDKWREEFIQSEGIIQLIRVIDSLEGVDSFADKALLLATKFVDILKNKTESARVMLLRCGGDLFRMLMKRVHAVSSREESIALKGFFQSAFSLIETLLFGSGEERALNITLFNEEFLEWLYTILACSTNLDAAKSCSDFIIKKALPANTSAIFTRVVDFMLSKIGTLSTMKSSNTEFSRCICALLGEYSKKEDTPLSEPSGCRELICQIVEMMKRHEIVEKRGIPGFDYQLYAMLSILGALFYKAENVEIARECGIVEEVFANCLMAIPTKDNHGINAPPKCKSMVSRTCAFNTLKKIVNQSSAAAAEVCTLAQKIVNSYKERYLRWHYDPCTFRRADCGFSGLVNQGCTCYMNSVLEQVFMTSAFRNGVLQLPKLPKKKPEEGAAPSADSAAAAAAAVDDEKPDNEDAAEFGVLEEDKLIPRLQTLFSRMIASESMAQDTKAFVCTLTHDGAPVNPYEQMDAEEFLTSLLSKVEEYSKACGKPKFPEDVFYGVFERDIIAEGCPHKRVRNEQFISLQVDVSGKKNIEDSLVACFETEMFSDYKCEECDKRYDTIRKSSIGSLPPTLFVHCKRFEFNMDTLRRYKITDEYTFPTKLDLSKYVKEGVAAPEYTLVGVVVHSGTADSGHYYSFIRDRSSPEEKWYCFNDSRVEPFDPNDIPKECFGGTEKRPRYDEKTRKYYEVTVPKVNSGYLLVYEQLDKVKSTSLAESEKFIPKKILDDIWKENEEFLMDSSVFRTEFFDCLITSVEKHIAEVESDAEMSDGNKNGACFGQLADSTMLLTEFVLAVMVHSTQLQNIERAFDALAKGYSIMPDLCSWFLEECVKNRWLESLFSECPIPRVRTSALKLVRVIFHHACEVHRDILDSYLPEGEMTDVPEVPDDPLLQDWPRGEAASPVTRFIDSYVKNLRLMSNYWKTFTDYFCVIEEFAKVGQREREHLLSRHTVAMLVDLYMHEESPLAAQCKYKREPMNDKKSFPDFTKLFDALYACLVDLEPLSSYLEENPKTEPSALLQPADRDLLFRSKFLDFVLEDHEASPGLSKLLCSCCFESAKRSSLVMKVILSHLSFPDYRTAALLLLDMKDSLHEHRAKHLMKSLADVVDSPSPVTNTYGYKTVDGVSDKDKGEALCLMTDMVCKEKDSTVMHDLAVEHRDKWLGWGLLQTVDPIVRQNTLRLLVSCLEVPASNSTQETESSAVNEEFASKLLESLMKLLRVAERSIVPPARVTGVNYHEDYDWRLQEYGKAVKACLVNEKLCTQFRKDICQFAGLVKLVDAKCFVRDKSKWALFEALMEGIHGDAGNLEVLISDKKFLENMYGWSFTVPDDDDSNVAMFCELLDRLVRVNKEITIGYLENAEIVYWLLGFVADKPEQYPKSASILMSLTEFCMQSPEVGYSFTRGFLNWTCSALDWAEMLRRVGLVAQLKTRFHSIMSPVFNTQEMLKAVIGILNNNPECFLPVLKLISLFIHDVDKFRPFIIRYVMKSHNCYVNTLDEQEFPPTEENLKSMEDDFEIVLQELCPTTQEGVSNLFKAFVFPPTGGAHYQVAMPVKSDAADRAVHRILREGMNTIGRDALLGLCAAYFAVCSRDMKDLAQFASHVQSLFPLALADPPVSFGADEIVDALITTIETPAYCAEVQQLLSACFRKSTLFELKDSVIQHLNEAVRFVTDEAGLQKIFILCHSPVVMPHVEIFIGALESRVKEDCKKHFPNIRAVIEDTRRYTAQLTAVPVASNPPAPAPAPVSQERPPVSTSSVPAPNPPAYASQETHPSNPANPPTDMPRNQQVQQEGNGDDQIRQSHPQDVGNDEMN